MTVQVSVVIPTYNAGKFIGATVDSVLRQTYRDLEVIIVDDASNDDTVEIVRGIASGDPRVWLICLHENSGSPARPRNTGVSAAHGKWIAFLDADDIWHRQKIQLQLKVLAEHSLQMCSTQMKDFIGVPPSDMEVAAEFATRMVTLRDQLIKYRTPTSSIIALRRVLLECGFDEDRCLKAREDTDCFIRIHEIIGKSVKILTPLLYYRIQEHQISGSKLAMFSRHAWMLRRLRFRDGRRLGLMAFAYTATHFLASIYIRGIRREL